MSTVQIACTLNYVVDGGRTVWIGAARTDPAYRGQNVFNTLRLHALVETLLARPTLEKFRISSVNVKYYSEWKVLPGQRFISIKVLLKRLVI